MDHLVVANSSLMFFLCLGVIIIVLCQAMLFVRIAWKRGAEIGIQQSVMKKAMTNSAIFSIIPSLPIIIMLMVLSVPLGKYFPWLRLSVVGSALYESMAADAVAKASGLASMSDPGFNLSIFTIAMWVMTIGIVWGIIFNIFFMRSLDQFSKKLKASNNRFVPIFSSALFMGMLALMTAPYMVNVHNITGIVALVAAALGALLCNYVTQVTNIKAIREFSLPISLLIGMSAAIIYTQLFVA
ncbi:MAG: DUF5058 family protein [Synergistaceae bacterium]|nr:DUF5058 family protein [Synergistaceae bacterium]MBP9626869.1 DUF5058 family protein [Synergistaceae bacterium]